MYTHILRLIHRVLRVLLRKGRLNRSSIPMASLRSTTHRNPSLFRLAACHRTVLVHLEHPPLLRLLARNVYTFCLLITAGHEPNLLVSIAQRYTACI